jgi:hypothetical protein
MGITLEESKGYKIAGDKREFLSGEINKFCSSPNSIRLVKSDRMRLARHAARTKVCEILAEFRQPNPQGQRHIWRPRLGLNVNIIMNCKAWVGMVWRGFI